MKNTKKMGRPISANPKKTTIAFRTDSETLDLLDKHCKKNNLTRSDMLRLMIQKYK